MTIPEFWKIVRKIDSLSGLEAKHDRDIQALRGDLNELLARVTRLEAREGIVIVEAKAAAGSAASVVAATFLTDIARRVGILEARSGLLPPAGT